MQENFTIFTFDATSGRCKQPQFFGCHLASECFLPRSLLIIHFHFHLHFHYHLHFHFLLSLSPPLSLSIFTITSTFILYFAFYATLGRCKQLQFFGCHLASEKFFPRSLIHFHFHLHFHFLFCFRRNFGVVQAGAIFQVPSCIRVLPSSFSSSYTLSLHLHFHFHFNLHYHSHL